MEIGEDHRYTWPKAEKQPLWPFLLMPRRNQTAGDKAPAPVPASQGLLASPGSSTPTLPFAPQFYKVL